MVTRYENCWPAIMKGADVVIIVYNPDNRQHEQEVLLWCVWVSNRQPLLWYRHCLPSPFSKNKPVFNLTLCVSLNGYPTQPYPPTARPYGQPVINKPIQKQPLCSPSLPTSPPTIPPYPDQQHPIKIGSKIRIKIMHSIPTRPLS